MTFERGCTEVSDESLYKCQTVEGDHGGDNTIQYPVLKMEITRMVRIRMIFKPMIGNGLHYCNCHGTGCNKVRRHLKKNWVIWESEGLDQCRRRE